MRVFIIVFACLLAGCKHQKDESLLGRWQIVRLQGKDSAGKDLYVYDVRKDTAKKYVSFINDTTYKNLDSSQKKEDTVHYMLVGDPIFAQRGIRNYSLQMITEDSVIITGDDQSSITIVRVDKKKQ